MTAVPRNMSPLNLKAGTVLSIQACVIIIILYLVPAISPSLRVGDIVDVNPITFLARCRSCANAQSVLAKMSLTNRRLASVHGKYGNEWSPMTP